MPAIDATPPDQSTVVLCGDDAEALAATANDLRTRGLRVAVWLGAPDADGIAEMVAELFSPRPVERPE